MRASPLFRALSFLARRCRAFGAILALGVSLTAQGAYRFKTYGPDQGLTNLATTCIAQDATGYIWVGTEGGAFRYDGQRFLKFAQAEGLTGPEVNDLVSLSTGPLLAVTPGGPLRFDGRRFQSMRAGPGVSFKDRPRFGEAADGSVLMGTFSGLARSTDGGQSFERLAGVPPGAVVALWVDPTNGEVFAVQRVGVPGDEQTPDYHLLRGTPQAGGFRWDRQDLPKPYNTERYYMVMRDREGRFWAAGGRGLIRMAGWGQAPAEVALQPPGSPKLTLNGLYLDPQRRVWARTENGLILFDGDQRRVFDERQGLPAPWSNALLVDREGSLWVAAEGVHRLQGGFLWEGYTRKHGLPLDAAWALHRDRRDRLWAGTMRGLARREGQGFVLEPGTAERRINAIAEDAEGGLWAAGIGPDDAAGQEVLHRPPGAGAFETIAVASTGRTTISALAPDPAGGLWIGTGNAGLHRLSRRGGAWLAERVEVPGGPKEESISRIRVDPEGRVWTAGSAGIAVREGGAWRRLGPGDGLKEAWVYSLARDPAGRMWFGYYTARGLGRLERGPGGWRVAEHLEQPEGLVKDDIVSLECGGDGALWLGTTGGVKRWKEGRVEQFTRSQGLPGEDCVGQSLWLDRNGDVWAGTSSGLARFDHEAYKGPSPVPRARITVIKDGSGTVRATSDAPLGVAYRYRSLDFEFECLSFLDESHLRPEVRLAGFENPWREAGGRAIRFTTLPPGRYTFAVRFVDANGQAGPEATQDIIVLRPWWQSWWFLALVGFVLAAMVTALVRWRTRLLKRRTLELEQLVELRTRDLQAANVALEAASMADALTGLKNRRYLQLYMPEDEAQVQRAYRTAAALNAPPRGEDLGLLLVDLDHFKAVNDTHGHAAGDAVLKQAADLLLDLCRETDAVARWGGEEFLVVARRVDRSAIDTIARKIRDAFESHPFLLPDGSVIRQTCSVGFAVHPINPLDSSAFHWEETLEAADICLYAAKTSGRNAWVGIFADPEGSGDPGPMRVVDLPDLVRAGKLQLRSSLPADGVNWSA